MPLSGSGWVALALSAGGVMFSAPAVSVAELTSPDFVIALGAWATAIHVAVCAWLTLVVVLVAVGRTTLPRWLAPRQLVAALIVGAVAAASPAIADPADRLDGLPLPDRPVHAFDVPQIRPSPTDPVVVAAGDSLWSIATERLHPQSDASTIAASVQRWYSTNAAIIGPDPNLIRPGQQLEAPENPSDEHQSETPPSETAPSEETQP